MDKYACLLYGLNREQLCIVSGEPYETFAGVFTFTDGTVRFSVSDEVRLRMNDEYMPDPGVKCSGIWCGGGSEIVLEPGDVVRVVTPNGAWHDYVFTHIEEGFGLNGGGGIGPLIQQLSEFFYQGANGDNGHNNGTGLMPDTRALRHLLNPTNGRNRKTVY